MNQGLFESLAGNFLDGTSVSDAPAKDRRITSVMDHLNRLFNTRRGTIPHLPDYGLPDISEIYRKMPGGIEELQSAIKKTVEKYEPRLTRIKVLKQENAASDLSLEYILSGEMIGGGTVRFKTKFSGTGNLSIAPWKRL